jgi:acetyl esterase/lipase
MSKHFPAFFLIVSVYIPAYSQVMPPPVKFKDFVFSNVTVEKNISYQAQIKPGTKKKYYLFDLYQPAGDTTLSRPVIIWIHGGGFKFGTKASRGTPAWSKTFAQRGYVCAAINYRLSKKRPLARFNDLADGCYDGVEDVIQVIEFIKKNYTQYKIDTRRIILAGNSAGGMIALQACYSSFSELAKLAQHADSNIVSTAHNPMNISAIINFWGAIFDTGWLKNAQVPIVSVHGSKDRVVPYNHKDIPLYGSSPIHRQADSLHISNNLKTYEGYGHELQKHFNPVFAGKKTKRRWLEAGQFAADFLYTQLFKQ